MVCLEITNDILVYDNSDISVDDKLEYNDICFL